MVVLPSKYLEKTLFIFHPEADVWEYEDSNESNWSNHARECYPIAVSIPEFIYLVSLVTSRFLSEHQDFSRIIKVSLENQCFSRKNKVSLETSRFLSKPTTSTISLFKPDTIRMYAFPGYLR